MLSVNVPADTLRASHKMPLMIDQTINENKNCFRQLDGLFDKSTIVLVPDQVNMTLLAILDSISRL